MAAIRLALVLFAPVQAQQVAGNNIRAALVADGPPVSGKTWTVALHFVHDRADKVGGTIARGLQGAGIDPTAQIPGTNISYLDGAMFQATFTEGSTHAFLFGAGMMLVASLVIWIFLDVKHEELATDGPEAVAHVG